MAGLELKADLTPLNPLPHAQLVAATAPKLTPDQPTQLHFADTLSLIGYDQAQTDDQLVVTLYWEVIADSISTDYTSFVHLVDNAGSGLAQHDAPPGGVYYPTSLWQPGEVLRDQHALNLPASLSPGEYTLVAGLYRQVNGQLEPLGQSQTLGQITIH
jgi:hypothetical protein